MLQLFRIGAEGKFSEPNWIHLVTFNRKGLCLCRVAGLARRIFVTCNRSHSTRSKSKNITISTHLYPSNAACLKIVLDLKLLQDQKLISSPQIQWIWLGIQFSLTSQDVVKGKSGSKGGLCSYFCSKFQRNRHSGLTIFTCPYCTCICWWHGTLICLTYIPHYFTITSSTHHIFVYL